MATKVAGKDHNLRFFQVPFNLKQNEAFTFEHLQHKPVATEDGFTGEQNHTVNLLKACEELGVNMITVRSAESGQQKDIPLPNKIGDGLRPGVPRIL